MVNRDETTTSLSPPTSKGESPRPLDRLRRINQACERFEGAWRRAEHPRIEDYLEISPPEDRAQLLRELIELEVELRQAAGQAVSPTDYRARFPALADASTIDAQSSRRTAFETPASVGPYELLGMLGCGGMGVVYRARQPGANRLVALKVMRAGCYALPEEARRFRTEAEAAANLDHPNILPIYEVGELGTQPYFTMKLMEGGSLASRLAEFIGQPTRTALLLAKVCRAVHYAHQRGFLHRDLKPSNILLDSSGEPHLTDFGLAKRVSATPSPSVPPPEATLTGVILGTPSYMPPEQAAGRISQLSPAADVYSLGATLYAMLTGQPPFLAETVMETVVHVTEREPVPPRRLRPDVPLDLQRICLKCLEKDPAARYVSAAALAEDLERYLQNEPVEARRVSLIGRLRRWGRREPALASRLFGIGAAVVLTEFNHAFAIPAAERIPGLHQQIIGLELLWIGILILLHLVARLRVEPGRLAPAWILLDAAALTALLIVLQGAESVLVLAYPLLIAASGLWSRVSLVWLATVASGLGCGVLWYTARSSGDLTHSHYFDVVIAMLVVTGFVVSHQVRRVWALSRFYEHRVTP